MRIHELISDHDVAIASSLGHVLMLTPEGAVFDNLDTTNLLNMVPAFGVLFDNSWRLATGLEYLMLVKPQDKLMHLVWSSRPLELA